MPAARHVVITAAGIGSRLGMNMPKCLVSVGGRPIVDHQLDQLRDIEDVRIVVGFQRDAVIEHVRNIREDVVFVLNSAYASTTVLQSLALGVVGLDEPFIALDGDVIPEPNSFKRFLRACEQRTPLTTYCRTKSTEPVYAYIDEPADGRPAVLLELARSPSSMWEWPGISYLEPEMIEPRSTFVFEQVRRHLPMAAIEIECWEVDTPEDLQIAEREL